MSAPTTAKLAEEVELEELDAIVEQTRWSPLDEEQHRRLKAAIALLALLSAAIAAKNASIRRLKKLLFGPKSEKTRKVLGNSDDTKEEGGEDAGSKDSGGQEATGGGDDGRESGNGSGEEAAKEKKKRKGHGRRAAEEYAAAERIYIAHESLKPGDPCPDVLCGAQGGKVYSLKDPSQVVRILGQAALFAVIYLLERLRCHLCGKIYTAKLPEDAGTEKYHITAVSMMAMLRYGAGVPLNRLAQLQSDLCVPLPPSTQWDVVSQPEPIFTPVHEELIRQAAQGKVVHNDDTNMVVLELLKENHEHEESGEALERTGVFTTGIVSVKDTIRIALFFTGRNHAGENLALVLAERAKELDPAIQMCDALSRNVPEDFKTILCNCLAHARRQYVDVTEDFPDESKFVIETLAKVFKNDEAARKLEMTDEERLEFHRKESMRPMAALRLWMLKAFRDRLVEPNSGLGRAIKYMRKHWRKLTRFLFVLEHPWTIIWLRDRSRRLSCIERIASFTKQSGARGSAIST